MKKMMTTKKITAFALMLLSITIGYSQTFINKGNITYERKIQIHKILEGNSWFTGNMDNVPKFYVTQFQLRFNKDTTVYNKTGDDEPGGASWAVYARENEVSTIFSANQSIVKKTIYQDGFIIKDSLPIYKWKLVNETRNIAGIECKKATTIINDSVFVVAFYAENIAVSGGPEQFGGLPGMILGIVVPRLHVSYYAQKVEANEKQEVIIPKQKNKSMTRKEFKDMVFKNMKWAFSNSSIGALYIFL
jgi:GLPGLI family protein